MNSLFIAHQPRRTPDKSLICSCRWHRDADVLPMSVRFHRWVLGFRQFRFDPIAQALQGHSLHVFVYALLYIQALVPLPFRVQVSCSPRSLCPELRPPPVAILSVRDTAHAFTLIRLLDTQAIFIGISTIEPFQLVRLDRCLLRVLAFATGKPVRLKP